LPVSPSGLHQQCPDGNHHPFISIYAYYFCQPRGGPCAKAPNPMTGERTYTHDRCNPGKVCNRIYSRTIGRSHCSALSRSASAET
jgi:hypothetical protein